MYHLQGEIKVDSGKMTLYTSNGKLLTDVKNGKFTFSDSIDLPLSASLILRSGSLVIYRSSQFFIESGTQAIVCHLKDSLDDVPSISNATTKEYRAYLAMLKPITDEIIKQGSLQGGTNTKVKMDSLNNLYYIKILNYTKVHPNSYVAFWSLFNFLPKGYNPLFDSIYNNLSIRIKSSSHGKMLSEKLFYLAELKRGNHFPQLTLRDTNDKEVVFLPDQLNNNYTLIDFWYSHCAPCKSQFPKLKEIYSNYKNAGFSIVGVSTDQADAINDWQKVIRDFNLDWIQLRDVGQQNANKLSIQFYPTNFLLDKNGVILERNISVENLQKILEKL